MNQTGVQRTAEVQAKTVYSERIPLNKVVDQDAGTFRNEVDFEKVLKGPATFIRMRSNEDLVLEFKHPELDSWQEFKEGLRDDIPLIVENEGWVGVRWQGTNQAVINLYASRVPEADRGD